MRAMQTRRNACALIAASLAMPSGLRARETSGPVNDRLRSLEDATGGRLGAAIVETGSSRSLAYRGGERFAMCSTFKALAGGLVLSRVDRGEERLDRRIVFDASDLVTYSPVTQTHVGGDGMAVSDICEAAITRSDNTAGNLLLASFGGPAGLTAFLRGIGDAESRLDRNEPTLNEALPGDPRDTTTPLAMAETLRTLLLGSVLSPSSRAKLRAWLIANQTGAARIRAGTPSDWRVGDKTGTGERGAASDVAILWPSPEGAPLILTVYLVGSSKPVAELNAAIADVARIMIAAAVPT